MLILILGLVLFLGTHAFTMARGPRARLVERLGENSYKVAYSVASLVGIVLVSIGYGEARYDPANVQIWYPPTWLAHVALLLMIFAFILFVATYLPGHIKARAKHPMLAAIKIWALAHLLANGDLASLILFVSFLAWAVAARISLKRRPVSPLAPARAATAAPAGWRNDAIAVTVGLVAYVAFAFWLHPILIGVPVVGAA
ncbi:NnrU family protein [Salinarimonas rosea]|uniref:NnrU family protein n=1 Tax=Salinarimonas rosea TaxID=552063 RepID=UPI0003FAF8F4|nr:NnrU family protein [Salinarimonas rosea]